MHTARISIRMSKTTCNEIESTMKFAWFSFASKRHIKRYNNKKANVYLLTVHRRIPRPKGYSSCRTYDYRHFVHHLLNWRHHFHSACYVQYYRRCDPFPLIVHRLDYYWNRLPCIQRLVRLVRLLDLDRQCRRPAPLQMCWRSGSFQHVHRPLQYRGGYFEGQKPKRGGWSINVKRSEYLILQNCTPWHKWKCECDECNKIKCSAANRLNF